MSKSTLPDGFDPVTRHIVMGRHLNAHQNMFGGVMLAWLDEAAALYTMETIGYTNIVTVAMDNVFVSNPARGGDLVHVACRVARTGRSSITIEAIADAHDPSTGEQRRIIDCECSFVAMRDGKPYPYFASNEYAAWKAESERDV